MRKESEEKIYDVRLLERNIYKGTINPKDLKKLLNSIEDSAHNSEEIDLDKEEKKPSQVQDQNTPQGNPTL